MDNKIRIVSDGTAWGTTVYGPNGEPINGITRISFDIDSSSGGIAEVTLKAVVDLDVTGTLKDLELKRLHELGRTVGMSAMER